MKIGKLTKGGILVAASITFVVSFAGCGDGMKAKEAAGQISSLQTGQPTSSGEAGASSQTSQTQSQTSAAQTQSKAALSSAYGKLSILFAMPGLSSAAKTQLNPNAALPAGVDIAAIKDQVLAFLDANAAMIKQLAGANAAQIVADLNDVLARLMAIDLTQLPQQIQDMIMAYIDIINEVIKILS